MQRLSVHDVILFCAASGVVPASPLATPPSSRRPSDPPSECEYTVEGEQGSFHVPPGLFILLAHCHAVSRPFVWCKMEYSSSFTSPTMSCGRWWQDMNRWSLDTFPIGFAFLICSVVDTVTSSWSRISCSSLYLCFFTTSNVFSQQPTAELTFSLVSRHPFCFQVDVGKEGIGSVQRAFCTRMIVVPGETSALVSLRHLPTNRSSRHSFRVALCRIRVLVDWFS